MRPTRSAAGAPWLCEAEAAAMRAGARGYLVKGSSQGEILAAIRAVGSGEAVFGAPIARRLIEYFSGEPAGPAEASRS